MGEEDAATNCSIGIVALFGTDFFFWCQTARLLIFVVLGALGISILFPSECFWVSSGSNLALMGIFYYRH